MMGHRSLWTSRHSAALAVLVILLVLVLALSEWNRREGEGG